MSIITIGIRGSGPGSGKDTACRYLCEYFKLKGVEVRHEKFATPIREVVKAITGVPIEVSETVEGKNFVHGDMTIGRLLQVLGSSVKASTYPDVWVDGLFRRFGSDEMVIISDVRFPNEQTAVRKRQGIILEIESNREVDEIQIAGRSMSHESERALDTHAADYKITNNGTIKELEEKLDEFVKIYWKH